MSSGKNSITTFRYIVIQVVRKSTRLRHFSLALYTGLRKWRLWLFSQSQVISERVCSYWLLYIVLLSDWWHRMSWLAVVISDVLYIIKLTSGNMTSGVTGDTVSWFESSWGGPAYSAATFPATFLSHHESLVLTGLKRESSNKWNKTWAGAKTGRGGCRKVASSGVSCYS